MKKVKKDKKIKNAPSSNDIQLPIIQKNTIKSNSKGSNYNIFKTKNNPKPLNINSNVNHSPQIPNILLPKNNEKNRKSLASTTNISQSTNKTRSKSGRKKKQYYYKEEINQNEELIKEDVPRISEEKLSQIKEQRKKRLNQAKLEEQKEMELYSKLLEEYKNNIGNKKNKNLLMLDNSKTQIISSQKAQKILEDGGMLDAYKYVLSQLCKYGLPTGNVFDYASLFVKNYEKKWKEKKSKIMKEKIDKYYEEKQKEINMNLENEGEIKKVNKSLEYREEYKFVKSLDKSRSKRNIIPRILTPTSHDNFSGFSRNVNKNFKIFKEVKTNLIKDENIFNNINIKKINLMKNNEIIKNNTIDTTFNNQYKNNKKKENENKITANNKSSNKIKKKK